jgi:hypothetical protein
MKRVCVLVIATVLGFAAPFAAAQQLPPPPAPTPEPPTRIEAKKEIIVNWSLGDQAWIFKDVSTAYEPVKGYIQPRGDQAGFLAVWKLRLVRDIEDGAAKLHTEMRGSPFKVVLLDADRTIINPDLTTAAEITPVSGKMDDTIELYVGLPDAQALRDVKLIRLQPRTQVGF